MQLAIGTKGQVRRGWGVKPEEVEWILEFDLGAELPKQSKAIYVEGVQEHPPYEL